MDKAKATAFGMELAALLNKHGIDSELDTPDFALAQHLMGALANLKRTLFLRDSWFAPKEETPDNTKETADG